MDAHDNQRGARIGTRIAMLVSQALIHTHTKLLDFKHKLAVMIFNTISNEISDEVDDTIGPLLKRMASKYEKDGHASALMDFMAHGRGQFKAIVGSSTAGQSLLWALSTVISNELAPISYGLIEANPHLLPDSNTAAQLAGLNRVSEDMASSAIAANGLNGEWAHAMIMAQKQYPSPADMADMVHKGVIDPSTFGSWAVFQGYADGVWQAYLAASEQPLSYQDVALAYMRGQVSEDAYYEAAKRNGVSASDAAIFLESIGEPPDTTSLMEGYRRGFIGRDEVEKGIRQSRIRDEWIGFIEQLRFSPMSIADAVNAVVQGHLSYQEGANIAEMNGLEPGQFDTLYQTAGAPLSRTELNDLFNRGVIGSDVVVQGLRESRLKDKYVQDAFDLRRRLLEPRSLGEAVSNGAMDHNTAVAKAMENGFNATDAAYLVNAASNRKMQSYRDRAMGNAEKLYIDGAVSVEQFHGLITSMGHTDAEAQIIIQSAGFERDQRAFNTATNVIRAKFIAHHIDKGQASAKLDAIGMQATQRDYLMGMWELEASANTRSLTEAQVIKAVKLQIFTPDQGAERLVTMGYSPDDATLLLAEI